MGEAPVKPSMLDLLRHELLSQSHIPVSLFSRVIAVASGKGGVGKSNFVTNFSQGLVLSGYRVLVFDGDLGMANLDVLFGVTPEKNLYHVLREETPLKNALFSIPGGPDLLAGGNGFIELSLLQGARFEGLLKELEALQQNYHFLIIDTGAGIGPHVLAFCDSADETIVVTTPEHPSLANAYGLIKVLAARDANIRLSVVSNRVESPEEGREVFTKLNGVSEKFINKKLVPLGHLFEDSAVFEGIKAQVPFLTRSPESRAAQSMAEMIKTFRREMGLEKGLKYVDEKVKEGMGGFFRKLITHLRGGR